MKLLSDEEVFGSGSDLLTDEEVFGVAKQPQQPRDAFEAAKFAQEKADKIERGWGEVASDTGVAALQGAMDFAALPGTLYGLATGNFDNAYSNIFRPGQEAADALKSDKLKAEQEALAAKVNAAEGWREKLSVGLMEGLQNGTLAWDQVARMVPGIIGGGGMGKVGEKVVTTAGQLAKAAPVAAAISGRAQPVAEAAASVVGKVGEAGRAVAASPVGKFIPDVATAGAVGTGSAIQSQSVVEDTLKEGNKIPVELFAENDPEYLPLVDQLVEGGLTRGQAMLKAREQRVSEMAQTAGLQAFAASLLTQAIPGGSTIETAALKKLKPGSGLKAAFEGGVKGAVFEPIQEGTEEASGSAVKDLQLSQADPSIDVIGNAAAAGGQGAALGLIAGAGAGTISHRGAPVPVGDGGTPTAAPGRASFSDPAGPAAQAGIRGIVVPLAQAAANGQAKAEEEASKVAEGGKPTEAMVAKVNPELERELGLDAMRMPNVSGTSVADAVVPAGGGVEGAERSGGVVPPGSAVDVGNEPGAGAAAAAPGGGTVQPAAETPGIVPTALTPTKVWTGRRGDGYATIGDANTALQSKQTASSKEGGDGLTWTVVPQADGRYVLHGYAPQQATQPADSRIGSEAPAVPSASGEVGGTLVAGATPIAGGGNVNPSVNPGTASPVLAGSPQAADQAGGGVAAAGGGVPGGRAAAAVPAGTAAVGSPTAPVHGGGEQAASLIDPAKIAEDITWVENDRLKRGEAIKLEVVTNEQDPTLANLATAMKAPIYFVRTKSGKSGFSGYARNGRIAINLSGKAAPVATVMHEAVHTMPAALRKALIDKVMPELSLGAREEFLRRYPAYANRPEDKIQEEIVAKLTENAVEEPAFWEDVKTKLGDNDFKGLVKHILSTLTRLIGAAKAHNNTDLARDWTKVRSLIAEATAKTMKGDTAWIEEATEDRATMEGVEVTEIDPDQVGDAEYAEEGKEPEPAAAAQGRQYNIGTERGNRAVAGFASLSDNEQAAIWAGAVELGLPERTIMSLLRSARSTKRRHPPRAGWAQIEAVGVEAVTEDDGTVKLDKTGKPVAEVKWKTIAYGFNVPPGAKKAPQKRDTALVGQVAVQFKRMINDIFRRAAEGDQTAVNIIAHQTWYRGVAEVLRREFGAQGDLFADLLGATSPNTPVNTNWRFAIEILHRFSRGEFDTVMTDFIKYLEEGGSPDEYRKAGHEKIRQASGKLYGMNSVNSMIALANLWRNIEPGTWPKARNFALNLIGQSNMATIDVWAARMLRRAANSIRGMSLPRIPPPAEKGLTGKWNVDATDVGGEFGFGAAVLQQVSNELAAEGVEMSPPDLQAIAWFAEKELWTQNDWTTVAGEGGSFEENIEATPTNRFVFGFSVQQGNKRPEPGVPSAAQARILATIKGDDLVLTARIKPTYGMFMGKAEEAFDIEIVTKPGFDPSLMLSELSKLAKERTQSSVFISRVLGPTEKNSNARPGAEVYFKAGTKMAQIRDVMREFRLRGIDGFTLAVDPRAITVDKPAKEFVAVRVQYVPEYDESASPDTIDATLTQKTIELDAAVQALRQNPKVAFARAYQYDTEVLSGNTYDDYIDRAAGTDDRQAGGTPWPERSVRARLEGAAERIQSDARPVEGAAIPGAGGGQAQAAAEGNFSEDARPAEPPRGSSYGRDEGAGRGVRGAVTGVHYGNAAGLSILSGRAFGQGIRGEERARLDAATDERIKRRVYFYLTNNGQDLPAPESGLGGHVYRAELGNLYDVTTATKEQRQLIQGLRKGPGENAYESAILDAGFRGHVNREQGTAVVLNSDVPVAYEGTIDWTRVRQRVNERIVPPIETREEGGELVRKITNEQMLGVVKARPELAKVAPSFRLQYGEARVAADEAAAANAALADSGLQFNEDQIDTPAFKKWFKNSKVVDENGKPRVVYHGTDKGGFAEFRKPGGTRRGDLGIFATSNRHMAVSYVRRGRGQNMTFDDVGNDEVMPGVYPVYMSLQNPHEWDMDGANWDGSRPGMFEVYDADGEPVYSKDGNNYMELEEARKLASSVGGTFETFTPDVSTDQLVREARSMGKDGVIIRNVVDDGGGGNTFYAGEPADVYVAFEPNQIKAIFNTGTFDPATDDIRFSEDRLPFYSALDRAIEGGPKQAPVEQWLAFIKGLTGKGVKPDEVFWSGIEDWLKLQTGKVQRDAVRGFLASSGVKVEETVLGGDGMTEQQARDELAEKHFLKLDVNDRLRHIDEGDDYYDVDLASFAPKDRRAIQELVDVILDGGAKDAPKYDTYTLPGGKNYREVLLKLPKKRVLSRGWMVMHPNGMERKFFANEDEARAFAKQQGGWAVWEATDKEIGRNEGEYNSSHWDGHPNVIAHIRLNDRTIGGKKTLFVEELQSDWQQQRRKNLKIATTPMAMAGAEKQTPAAPFIDSTDKWLGLAIKRVLVEAVKGDYAQVAFVNGTQSADRYDLSKQIDAIDYRRITAGAADETDLHLVKNGSVIKTIAVKNADLENYVGKEMAKKIMANEGKQIEKNGFPMTRLDGLDLKIGGKGMITFYDSIVPTAANSLLKKLGGGKVAQISMPRYTVEPDGRGRWNVLEDGAIYENKPTEKIARALADRQNGDVPTQQAFDVTPEMKAKIEEGLPLFSEDYNPMSFNGFATSEEMMADRARREAEGASLGKAWDRVRAGWPEIKPDTSQTPVAWPAEKRPDPMTTFAGMGKGEYDARRAKLSFSEDAQYANNVAATRPRNVSSWAAGRDELGRFTFGPGAKVYEVTATIASNVLDKFKMKPISPELDRAMRKMKVEIEKAQMTAVDVANKLKEIPRDELEMISDVIEGELKAGVTPPQRVYDIAASMIEIMREQSTELVRLGMLSAEAVGRWDGKYLPRFYEQKLLEDLKAWKKMAAALTRRTGVMQGVAGKSLKARGKFETVFTKDLPIWIQQGWEVRDDKFQKGDKTVQVWRDYTKKEREDMGEVRDAMFRFIMGYTRTQRDIQLGRLFERLATDVAVRGPREGYVEVPSTKIEGTFAPRYGKLAGMYVPTEVLDHLKSYDDAMHSEILKMYRKGLSLWKEGKTVLNPVAHANNVISNLTMAHFAGVSYWDVNKYAGAVKDLTKNAPMVQEAKDAGLFLGTFSQGELVAAMPEQLRMLAGRVESRGAKTVETVWNAMSFWLRKPMGKAYEAEDQFFRYLIYRDARNKGASPDDAVDYAQRYIFTYDNLPSGAKLVRDVGLPFFAYTYKAVPAILRTAMEYPWRFAAPAGAFWAVNTLMYAMAFVGDDDDDDVLDVIGKYATDPQFRESVKAFEKDERKNLPSWMKGMSMTMFTPKAIRLGMDEVTNMPVFLDISRIFPGGDLLDANNNSGGMPIFQPLMPGNPVLTTAMAMLGNKDMFFGKEIVDKDLDTDTEAAAKRAAWMWRQVAPAIAVGNYHWDRAMNVVANVTGQPIEFGPVSYTGQDKSGNPVQWEYAAMQTFGVKARPIDLELTEKIDESNKKRIIRELSSEIKKINRLEGKGYYSETNAERMRENAKLKRDRVRSGLTIEGDPVDGEEEEE